MRPEINLKVIAPRGHALRDGGIVWSGVLTCDGKRVLIFENRGDGGCCRLDWKPGIDRAPIERALERLTTASFEAVDAGLGVLWDRAMMQACAS